MAASDRTGLQPISMRLLYCSLFSISKIYQILTQITKPSVIAQKVRQRNDGGKRDRVRVRASVIFKLQATAFSQSQMGLAVHFMPNSPLQKHTQQFNSEKEDYPCIGDQTYFADQFSTISTMSQQSAMSRKVPFFSCRRSPYGRKTLKASVNTLENWSQVLSSSHFLPWVLNFLTGEDLIVLKRCTGALRRASTVRLLQNQNNWNLTMTLLSPYMLRQTHLRQSNFSQEYEHSQDLDRTSGYFESQNQETMNENRLKLDRIITTISFEVRYFQGIMPICAALLQCFNETVSYWVLKYMLFKCKYIQNDIEFYSHYLLELEEQFKIVLPVLHKYLEQMGFQLNYFVMKWVMGLFSEDMSKSMLLSLWDLLCHTDVYILMYVIIEIFKLFEEEILQRQADDINEILKVRLKQRLSEVNIGELIIRIKSLYVSRRLSRG